MSAHTEEEPHDAGTTKLFVSVWVWLLVMTAVEVFLGYIHFDLKMKLTILLGLSIIKAALIMAYFMHLRFERLSLILTLVPAMVMCICLLFVFFPDSFRSSSLRYKFSGHDQTTGVNP
ncbi:MAG TPA: cytochrome C oxidase subunit IV family protein [Pyrinomonadaceae bacterium]|nr:cytochrome C oxidase subunit IV family protein [Pyrinomonadaceae bacterium]